MGVFLLFSLILAYSAILFPIIAAVFWFIKFDGYNYRASVLFTAILLCSILAFVFRDWIRLAPKLTGWLYVYGFGLAFNLALFLKHYGLEHLHKALALSMFVVFIASDIWEYPVFVYGLLGFPKYAPWLGQWFDHIHRFYVIVAAYLMIKLTKIRNVRPIIYTAITGLAVSFVLLWPAPFNLGYVFVTLSRAVVLVLMGLGVYLAMPGAQYEPRIVFRL